VKRCLILMKANKEAAMAFYRQLHHFAPLSALTKFIGTLYRYIAKFIDGNSHKRPIEDKENDDTIDHEDANDSQVALPSNNASFDGE
jgi:hypothetical protein